MTCRVTAGMAHIGRVVIVDCRFSYEYQGGHIVNAKNIQTRKLLHQLYEDDHST